MAIDTLENKTAPTVTYAPILKPIKINKDSAIIEWFMTALIILITVAVIATYFVVFEGANSINFKQATFNTIWFAVGNFAIGGLAKKIFRRKCEKTKEYVDAGNEANDEINNLCANDGRRIAPAYCKDYAKQSIKRYREHQLALVGMTIRQFHRHYLGISFGKLWKLWRKKTLSFSQCRAVWRCNRIKMKAYNPYFILSYNSTAKDMLSPSDMYNTKRANAVDNVKSFILGILSAVGIGFVFSDVLLNFSLIVLFEAIIKTIMIAVTLGLKATFGWNLGVMEIQRNKLRASEARACLAWGKDNPKLVEDYDKEDEEDERVLEEVLAKNESSNEVAVATA